MENKTAVVLAVNISGGGIPKLSHESVNLTQEGLEGDGHNHKKHYRPEQAVCLQDIETLEQLNREGYSLTPGDIGENLTVRHLDVNHLSIGTRLTFSGGVVLEITKMRNPCYVLDAIHPKLQADIKGRCGMYAKVLETGTLSPAETISIV
ncbi:MAG: MOSC domain-containing protein [bacterium]|nr:MOSC domain-containing protein [bacterium]